MDKFAICQEQIYFYMSKIPGWMYIVLSGGLGSLFLNLFHRKKPTTATPVTAPQKPNPDTAIQPPEVAENDPVRVGAKKGGAQKRMGRKK